MTHEVERFELPAIGRRSEFMTRSGVRVGVLEHLSGARDLLVYDTVDTDRCQDVVRLEDDEARTMAELLGAVDVGVGTPQRIMVGASAIDWVEVGSGWQSLEPPASGLRSGVQIVAVVRDGSAVPIGTIEQLQIGDVLVLIGDPQALESAIADLESGP